MFLFGEKINKNWIILRHTYFSSFITLLFVAVSLVSVASRWGSIKGCVCVWGGGGGGEGSSHRA